MLTPLKRAEKILREMLGIDNPEYQYTNFQKKTISHIAAQIEEACAESLKNDLKTECFCLGPRTYVSIRCRGCHGIIYSEYGFDDYKKGFSAAKERAKGIVAEHVPCWGDKSTGPEVCKNNEICELHYNLADCIDQMTPDVSSL